MSKGKCFNSEVKSVQKLRCVFAGNRSGLSRTFISVRKGVLLHAAGKGA